MLAAWVSVRRSRLSIADTISPVLVWMLWLLSETIASPWLAPPPT